MDKKFYNELIQRIEIEDIALGDVMIKKNHEFLQDVGGAIEVDVNFYPSVPVIVGTQLWAKGDFQVNADSRESADGVSIPAFSLEFDITVRFSIQTDDEHLPFDFADYTNELEEFASRNLPINLWPYAREFISSMTARMGFPPLFIGMYKYIPKS